METYRRIAKLPPDFWDYTPHCRGIPLPNNVKITLIHSPSLAVYHFFVKIYQPVLNFVKPKTRAPPCSTGFFNNLTLFFRNNTIYIINLLRRGIGIYPYNKLDYIYILFIVKSVKFVKLCSYSKDSCGFSGLTKWL